MDSRRGANSMGKRKSAMLVFRILEILRNYATRSKPMKLMRILERLDADYTESVDRGTLKDYISEISGEEGDDTPVICEGHGRKGYYARQYFTDMELRILINDVLAARQIEENIAKGLIKKLIALSPVTLENYRKSVLYIPDMNHSENIMLERYVDLLNEAIVRGVKVEITPGRRLLNSEIVAEKKAGVVRRYIADPYAIILSMQNYYLICHVPRENETEPHIEQRRVDRIFSLRILSDQKAFPVTSIRGFEHGLEIGAFLRQHIYMFSGPVGSIILKVKKGGIKEIVDWHGDDYKVLSGDDESDYSIIRIKNNVNAVKFWAVQYADFVEVLKPQSLRQDVIDYLKEKLEMYSQTDRGCAPTACDEAALVK